MTGNYIIVNEKDEQRARAMQQPLTRVLLRLFSKSCPTNISTAMTMGTQAEVWAQLQRYVRETLPDSQIEFSTL